MTIRSMLLATAAVVATSSFAYAADQQLSGTITTAGKGLDGAVVSAKRDGSNITTSVYSDAQGNYYFPPMAAGKYSVWAQTLGFEQNKVAVDLQANKRQDLALKQITDPASGITQFGYDANDNLTSVTDPRTLVTSYGYNGFGDLLTQTSPDTGITTNTLRLRRQPRHVHRTARVGEKL